MKARIEIDLEEYRGMIEDEVRRQLQGMGLLRFVSDVTRKQVVKALGNAGSVISQGRRIHLLEKRVDALDGKGE